MNGQSYMLFQTAAFGLLLETPASDITRTLIEEHFPEQDAYWRERVQEGTGMPIALVSLDGPACADWMDCYVDYGHMNRAGARAFSEALGKLLANGPSAAIATGQ